MAAAEACSLYEPDFYLVDAEAHAKNQFAAAKVFAPLLRKSLPAIPIGMCSYWKPSYHRELPWDTLRAECDFDAPQVYWRGSLPVGKLQTSMKEYKLFNRKLPFSIAGGDMYYEYGIKPTSGQVTDFLAAAEKEPEIKGVLMWSMDQMSKAPELWKAFSDYKWAEAAASPVFPREAFLAKRVVLSEGGKITIVGETPTHYITQMYFDRPYIQGG